jgi:hypothetical protein
MDDRSTTPDPATVKWFGVPLTEMPRDELERACAFLFAQHNKMMGMLFPEKTHG